VEPVIRDLWFVMSLGLVVAVATLGAAVYVLFGDAATALAAIRRRLRSQRKSPH